MSATPDYYAVLGVSPDSEDIVIQAAYRALMRRYHPDKNSSKEAQRKTIEINAAYAILGNPAKRAAYDEQRSNTDGSKGDPEPASPPEPPKKDVPSGGTEVIRAWNARSSGLAFASIITIFVILVAIINASNSTSSAGQNLMNVDENLTTTDMNAVDMNAVDMNATDMNATDMNATDMNATDINVIALSTPSSPPDLSRQPQTPVSYTVIEDAADQVAKIIVTRGVAGARAYSEECHKSVQNLPSWDAADRCAAFDYAAAYIDAAVSSQAGWPKSGYFEFQRGNESDDYAAVGAPSFTTFSRLPKIQSAAQDAALEAFKIEVARQNTIARMRAGQSPATATTSPESGNSSD